MPSVGKKILEHGGSCQPQLTSENMMMIIAIITIVYLQYMLQQQMELTGEKHQKLSLLILSSFGLGAM